jgi:hypothetical protein
MERLDRIAAPARLTLDSGQVYEGVATLQGSDPETLAPGWSGMLLVRNWAHIPWPQPASGIGGMLVILRSGRTGRCTVVSCTQPRNRGRQSMHLGLLHAL